MDIANNLANFLVAILTIAGVVIGIIAWFIRLESEVRHTKENMKMFMTAHNLKIEEIKNDHKHELGVLWEKIDDVQKSVYTLLTTVGRVEGKLGLKNHNP